MSPHLVQRCDTVETVEVLAYAVPAGVEAIKAAIEKSPHADVTIRIIKGIGHGIMSRVEERQLFFMPGYPELMLEWISQRVTIERRWAEN